MRLDKAVNRKRRGSQSDLEEPDSETKMAKQANKTPVKNEKLLCLLNFLIKDYF